MADITKTYTIPDALVSEMIDVFSVGYEAQIPDPENEGQTIPNPQTKNAYASEQFDETVKLAIRRKVVQYRKQQAVINQEFELT